MTVRSGSFIARTGAFAESAATKRIWLIATTVAVAATAYAGRLGLTLSDGYTTYHREKVAMESAFAEMNPLPYVYDRVKQIEADREQVVEQYWNLLEAAESPDAAPPRDGLAEAAAQLLEVRANVRGTLGLIESLSFSDTRLENARVKLKDAVKQSDDVFTGFNNAYTYFLGEVSPVAIKMRVNNDVLPADERSAIAVVAATNALREAHVAAMSKQKAEIEHLINIRRLLVMQLTIGICAVAVVVTYVSAVILAIRKTRLPGPDLHLH